MTVTWNKYIMADAKVTEFIRSFMIRNAVEHGFVESVCSNKTVYWSFGLNYVDYWYTKQKTVDIKKSSKSEAPVL